MAVKKLETILRNIDAIRTTGRKLDDAIQSCGIDVLYHLQAHQDISVVNKLYNALPRGARLQAMAAWLFEFAAVRANTDKETKAENPFLFDKSKETRPEDAKATEWFTFKPAPAPDQVFDLKQAIMAALRKAGKNTVGVRGSQGMVDKVCDAMGIDKATLPALNFIDEGEAALKA